MKRILTIVLAVGFLSLPSCQTEKPTEKLPEGSNPVVVLETTMGTIKIELFEDKAPVSVKNFLAYVDDRFYDGTIFHRVIPNFMIQGGGFEPGMKKEKPTRAAIKNESANNLPNLRGTVAMARTGEPDSATAQFFINVQDNRSLDRASAQDGVGYCVFGRVVEGMDVVDRIRVVPTHTVQVPEPRSPLGFAEHENVPEKDVVILSIRRAEPTSQTAKD